METEKVAKATISRISTVVHTEEDDAVEVTAPKLRPTLFEDYPGQDRVKENLKIYVAAAKKRHRPLDHVILHGAPGLGKTTLAHIVANELGVAFQATSGPAIDKPGDLAGILAGLEPNSLLFIDEIHRLGIKVEEVLYSAMEDFCIDIIIGQGASARSVRMDVAPFTLVGATTRLSLLSRPMLSRFGIQEHLDFYTPEALCEILTRSAFILDIAISKDAVYEIASRSRGTPRLANRLLKRVWDFTDVQNLSSVTKESADIALRRQDMDHSGLDQLDRSILRVIEGQYDGGPVGVETIAVTLNEDRFTIEDVYEPFLVYKGYLARTPRGRSITQRGRDHLLSVADFN